MEIDWKRIEDHEVKPFASCLITTVPGLSMRLGTLL